MRKKAIVNDFKQVPLSGTLVMKEKINFLCSKMMDIQDIARIGHNFTISDLSNINIDYLYNTSYDTLKLKYLIDLSIDNTQSKIEADTSTKWIFKINTKELLKDFLYNEIYTYNDIGSPFREFLNFNTDLKIKDICLDYIEQNVLDRYKIKEIILWTKFYRLDKNTVPGSGSNIEYDPEIKLLYKKPVFSFRAIPDIDRNKRDLKKQIISTKQYADGMVEIGYKQVKNQEDRTEGNSNYETFIYYFDIIFEKI